MLLSSLRPWSLHHPLGYVPGQCKLVAAKTDSPSSSQHSCIIHLAANNLCRLLVTLLFRLYSHFLEYVFTIDIFPAACFALVIDQKPRERVYRVEPAAEETSAVSFPPCTPADDLRT